jgi:hypothetical protein
MFCSYYNPIMDPASLALSIAALYTTCRDCYNIFTTVKTAEAESSAHLRESEIQQSILKAWGFHWQIQNEDGIEPEYSNHTRRKRSKLHEYLLSNHFQGRRRLQHPFCSCRYIVQSGKTHQALWHPAPTSPDHTEMDGNRPITSS